MLKWIVMLVALLLLLMDLLTWFLATITVQGLLTPMAM